MGRRAVRREIDSPTYVGALYEPEGVAMVHPAKLAWGLRAACERLGVRFFENSPVRAIRSVPVGLRLETRQGALHAPKVAWGTGAFPGPLRRLKHYLAPVYDYALMTEPLTDEQMASLGWKGRQGVGDAANFFHYYRLTSDNRILWGGYDVVHHYGGKVRPEFDQRPETFLKLSEHFFATFPSWRACASRTRGAGSSTRAAGSPASSAPGTRADWPTPRATRAWAWGRPASARR